MIPQETDGLAMNGPQCYEQSLQIIAYAKGREDTYDRDTGIEGYRTLQADIANMMAEAQVYATLAMAAGHYHNGADWDRVQGNDGR